jgi:hypothetical protein
MAVAFTQKYLIQTIQDREGYAFLYELLHLNGRDQWVRVGPVTLETATQYGFDDSSPDVRRVFRS